MLVPSESRLGASISVLLHVVKCVYYNAQLKKIHPQAFRGINIVCKPAVLLKAAGFHVLC